MTMKVLLIGGHGKIALRMTKLLTARSHHVTSVIRNQDHASEISSISADYAHPVVESIEEITESRLKELMQGKDTVVWSAGAGGKGGPERTRNVDYHAATRTISAALDSPSVKKFMTISASVARDKSDFPSYWDDADRTTYQRAWDAIGLYCEMKTKADAYLTDAVKEHKRDDLLSIVLRPGTLSDEAGTGKVDLGKAKLAGNIPRDDVAEVAVKLLEGGLPAGDIMSKRNGVWWLDLVSGEESVDEAVKRVTEDGTTSQT